MKLCPFAEVVRDVTSKFNKILKSDYKPEGQYKIIDQGKVTWSSKNGHFC